MLTILIYFIFQMYILEDMTCPWLYKGQLITTTLCSYSLLRQCTNPCVGNGQLVRRVITANTTFILIRIRNSLNKRLGFITTYILCLVITLEVGTLTNTPTRQYLFHTLIQTRNHLNKMSELYRTHIICRCHRSRCGNANHYPTEIDVEITNKLEPGTI